MTVAKPDRFDPEVPPPGFDLKLVTFWRLRRFIVPSLQLVHTNAARGEGSVESSWNWAMNNIRPGFVHGDPVGKSYTTIPHLQVDRSGRGALLLPLNRQSITNAKANSFSIGIETGDTGTDDDPSISPFTDKQGESIAVAFAYAAWGYGIPLFYPKAWDGPGTACHTEPFGYPYWTSFNGKICPGSKKKAQTRDVIIPRARQILADWLDIEPPPTPPTPTPVTEAARMMLLAKSSDGGHYATTGLGAGSLHMETEITVDDAFAYGGGFALCVLDDKRLHVVARGSWASVPWPLTKAQVFAKFGPEI